MCLAQPAAEAHVGDPVHVVCMQQALAQHNGADVHGPAPIEVVLRLQGVHPAVPEEAHLRRVHHGFGSAPGAWCRAECDREALRTQTGTEVNGAVELMHAACVVSTGRCLPGGSVQTKMQGAKACMMLTLQRQM